MEDNVITSLSAALLECMKWLTVHGNNDTEEQKNFQQQAAQFFLWIEGFSNKDLEMISEVSKSVAATVLLHLMAMSKLLTTFCQRYRSKESILPEKYRLKLHDAISQARDNLLNENSVEYSMIDDTDDEYSSDTSSDAGSFPVAALKHRIQLLMRMVPAMQRVLSSGQEYDLFEGREASDENLMNIDHKEASSIAPGNIADNRTDVQTSSTPQPPQNKADMQFRDFLHMLSTTPIRWEDTGLLDEALSKVPLDQIYAQAEEEHNMLEGLAKSISDTTKTEWGYPDTVIRALLRWFKREFFVFVTNPACSACSLPTIAQGSVDTSPEERAYGAVKTELFKCSSRSCFHLTRFPRYRDARTLLETRKGRVGEFVNCFGMLARAMGARVRWVWNSEDHVWNEIYSVQQRRWVHVDPCEEYWDNPRNYTEGWGKKLAYCIAFSVDGATDVTRRYVRHPGTHGADRTRCEEGTLKWILLDIRKVRRADMSKDDRSRLLLEDEREERELSQIISKAREEQQTSASQANTKTHGSNVGRKASELDTELQHTAQGTPFWTQ